MVKAYAEEVSKDDRYDVRDKAMKIVEYVHSLWSDKNPVLLVYLTPPYYPHIYVEGARPEEKALIDAVNYAVTTTESDYKLVQKKFLPCISDLSQRQLLEVKPRGCGSFEAEHAPNSEPYTTRRSRHAGPSDPPVA